MKMSPLSFYNLTVREVAMAIKGHENALERDYALKFLACFNANGVVQGGKKFKMINPFEKEKPKNKPSKAQKEETLAFIKRKVGE